MNTLMTAYHSWGLLWPLLAWALDLGLAWQCHYKEFPVDEKKIGGAWFIYGTAPDSVKRCMVKQLDMYWNRITYTDYTHFAVELHCSAPWFLHPKSIYVRDRHPNSRVIRQVNDYLVSVKLKLADFQLVDQNTCKNDTGEPLQIWQPIKYMVLGYHQFYVKTLSDDENT